MALAKRKQGLFGRWALQGELDRILFASLYPDARRDKRAQVLKNHFFVGRIDAQEPESIFYTINRYVV
jgi:hypothetical protein